MHVIEFNQSIQGTPTKNTATVLIANGPEKENGSEKKEPLIQITAKTRKIVRNDGLKTIPITGEHTEKGNNAHHRHLIHPMQR
jgi:hypothetical protein